MVSAPWVVDLPAADEDPGRSRDDHRTIPGDDGANMTEDSEIRVSLSDELRRLLIARAAGSEVPLDWFVAGLVCDTIESIGDRCRADPSSATTLRLFLSDGADTRSADEPHKPRKDTLRLVRRASGEA